MSVDDYTGDLGRDCQMGLDHFDNGQQCVSLPIAWHPLRGYVVRCLDLASISEKLMV